MTVTREGGVDVQRALRAGLLAAWSLFFVWLWISGERARYLGPRTYWVIPFGVVFLGGAAFVHFLTMRSRAPRRASLSDGIGTALLVAPLLAVLVVPSADLGALAASRKATSVGLADFGAPPIEGVEPVENPTFIDIHHADQSPPYGEALGVTEGTEVRLVGFVTDHSEPAAGTDAAFTLTRFYVSCCAADAIPYSVPVIGATDIAYPVDTWYEVRGELVERGGRLVVDPQPGGSGIQQVPEPEDPYLY